MRFIFTCGGTAGHINPAIGIAAKLKEFVPDAQFLFIGAEGMMETELIPREGYEIKTIKISNISRSFSIQGIKHNIVTIYNVMSGIIAAKNIIREFSPSVVIGTGGYVCYPVLKAAHALGIPTMVHESNAIPGLTTKLLSKIVDYVMVGFSQTIKYYPSKAKVIYTGTPVRLGFETLTKKEARSRLGIMDSRPLVLSVWGSLGSDYMNKIMLDFIPLAIKKQKFKMIHSTGKHGYQKLFMSINSQLDQNDLTVAGIDIREYVYDMSLVMAASDLVVCRSGASTLGELEALGKPAILIPSPNVTNNHQEINARQLQNAGAAEVILEGEFNAESLYTFIDNLLNDRKRLDEMGESMKKCYKIDAASTIANLILKVANL